MRFDGMDKHVTVHPFTGILLGSEKEQVIDTGKNMEGSEKHVE